MTGSVRVVAEDLKGPDKPLDRLHCRRCGGDAFKPAANLAKAFDQPAYGIFECVTCGIFEWVAQ